MVKIQMIYFKTTKDGTSFLCLKRSPEDGEYWNLLVGTQEAGETDRETIVRESNEELGITIEKFTIIPNCSFKWMKGDVEVDEKSYLISDLNDEILDQIKLNPEHTEFKWCNFNEAFELLEKINNKKCITAGKNKLNYINSFQEI